MDQRTNIAAALPPASSSPPDKPPSQTTQRLLSLDALRGFDMFWILGADEVVIELSKVGRTPLLQSLAGQMEHKPWEGFAFMDLIFPLFVFIAGVSVVFSLGKQIERKGKAAAIRRIVVRSLVLFLLGVLYYGGFSKHLADVRWLGVLQRIALCYLAAGLLFCFLRVRGLAIVCVALLLGYCLLLSFVPAPGRDSVSLAEGENLANYVDAQYLPGRKWDGDHDPEGLLSTLPAIATCLLGVLAGLLLKNDGVALRRKVLVLLVAGVFGVGLGFAWGLQFPVIKKLWTSSYVLVAGGYSAILLGLFYLVMDVWRWRRWARVFVWIGSNAITLYLLTALIDFPKLAERLIGGDVQHYVFGQYGPLAASVLVVLLVLAVARFLYVRQILLRV